MARVLAVLLVAVTTAVASAVASGAALERPRLVVSTTHPFVVRGLNFRSAERVRVTLRVNGSTYGRRPTTSLAGRFTSRFDGISLPYCTGYVISALGNKGSRAGAKFVPECPAP